MSFFRDLFSARRRSPKVAVNWMVDVSIPNTNPTRWTEFFATHLSTRGIRLKGLEPDQVRRLLNYEPTTHLREGVQKAVAWSGVAASDEARRASG